METFESLPDQSLSPLISSAEGSPVKMFPELGCGAGSEAAPGLDFMQKCSDWLALYDRDSCSWRTSQACLALPPQESLGQFQEYLETWPRSGSMRNGKVYRRPPLVPLTYEIEYSYLPTPQANLGKFERVSQMAKGQVVSWFNQESTGFRPSGARIGSSLAWCREFIQEHLRTGGELNPEWLEALMGFPIGWTDLPDSEMP